jgi:hypothetical protein
MITRTESSITLTLKECGIEISKSPCISKPNKLDVVSSPLEPEVMIDILVLTMVKHISEPGKDLVGMLTDQAYMMEDGINMKWLPLTDKDKESILMEDM